MRLPIYQVDAFTSRLFGGNPAAVVPLTQALDESLMQQIASENNLSETAFFYPESGTYRLRWFTPVAEVPLCGHATLATAAVIFEYLDPDAQQLRFSTVSGELRVTKAGIGLQMDFPKMSYEPYSPPDNLVSALGDAPAQMLKVLGDANLMVIFEDEAQVRELTPDLTYLKHLGSMGVIVTARSYRDGVDFVSRYFAPGIGIDEDPVTGSIHCALAPYWADVLGKSSLRAEQVSERRGELGCSVTEDRVMISGQARMYLTGEITI